MFVCCCVGQAKVNGATIVGEEASLDFLGRSDIVTRSPQIEKIGLDQILAGCVGRSAACSLVCCGPVGLQRALTTRQSVMGCGGSKAAANEAAAVELPEYDPPTAPAALAWKYNWPEGAEGPLTVKQLRGRLSYELTRTISIPCGYKLTYGAVSQRGYYPGQSSKPNQDAFKIQLSLFGDHGHWFSVFDGHGPSGEKVAQYAAKNVYQKFGASMAANSDISDAMRTSHLTTNKDVVKESSIDDRHSGTTAISVFLDGTTGVFTIANVGDSRTMLGSRASGETEFTSVALSQDQTPYRRDERERVKKCGARVMTMDQLEGLKPMHENWDCNLGEEIDDDGDPPRLWAQDGLGPGTAFTRSIGDRMAEQVGVIAEPEIQSHTLVASDRVMIIASDGVFEFITTKRFIEIAALFTNPIHACHALIAEAYKAWMTNEDRTDDITLIVMYIENDARRVSEVNLRVSEDLSNPTVQPTPDEAPAAEPPTRRGSMFSPAQPAAAPVPKLEKTRRGSMMDSHKTEDAVEGANAEA